MFDPRRWAPLSALALAACATVDPDGPLPDWPSGAAEAAARFERDLTTLAGDDYEGREAGTAGYEKAVAYVVGAFEELGLTPAGTDGYLQPVPLRRATRVLDRQEATFEADGQTIALRPIDDVLLDAPIVTDPGATEGAARASGEVVFAGYGLDAPELGLDSYEDLDVAGKIVLLLQGTPDGMPSEEGAHFTRTTTKIATAAERGAAGVLFLSEQDMAEEGARERAERYAGTADDTFAGEKAEQEGLVTGYLMQDAAARLFAAEGLDPDAVVTPDEAGRVAPLALSGTMTLATAATFENYASPNVVAMIEGSDPALRGEYVVLTGHLDHEGVGEGEGDVIYNGAMDNASGIATMLETARRFARDGERPRRSVLFVAVTAEEKGLLGSDYFARNPTVPASAMVANVNLDMPILLHEFEDVIAFGSEHSTLRPIVDEAAASMGVELIADPVPDMVLFVRSDHYSFVKQGVPSVFLFLGFGNGGQEAFEGFMATHYHQVTDEPGNPDLPIDYDVGAKFAALNYRIAKAIANAEERPTWNEGDFFGRVYGGVTGS